MTPEEESLVRKIMEEYEKGSGLDKPGLLKAVVASGVSKNQEDAWEFVDKWKREGIRSSLFYKTILIKKKSDLEEDIYKVGKKFSLSSLYSLFRKT